MHDFESFMQYVKDHIKEHLPEEFADSEVSINTVCKNNGKQLHAICIRTGDCSVSPNIYLDGFYESYREQGMDMDVVLERVAQMEIEHANPSEEFSSIVEEFQNADFIKRRVVMAVVNAEKNETMLKETPHKMKEDLAIIYKIFLGGDNEGIGTITIKNDHMAAWGMSVDELHECALENSKRLMPAVVQDMGSLLGDLMDMDDMPMVAEEKMMYVISNEQRVGGAATMLYSDALERIADRIGTDLYVLPSSIHETIAISANGADPEELACMVKEINATQVSLEEQLSDHVYHYDAKTKTLSLADTEAKSEELSKVSENKQAYEATTQGTVRPRHHR